MHGYNAKPALNLLTLKLYHKIYGQGPPVLILHGLFGSGDNWRTITRFLEDQYTCIVVDLRNHGRSPHDKLMDLLAMSADVLELIDDLRLEKVALIGHSMGGKVAMYTALTSPESVSHLVVVDIAPRKYAPLHDQVFAAIQAVEPASMNTRQEVESLLSDRLNGDLAVVQFLMKNLTRNQDGSLKWKANMPVIMDAYNRLVDEVSASGVYSGPTLFIRGEQSDYVSEDDMNDILTLFPLARLVTIPGAGHWVHADQPEEMALELAHFLGAGQ